MFRQHRLSTALLVALVAAALATPAAAATWTVDPAHTEVNFAVSHFFTPVTGSFKEFEVDLAYNDQDPAASRVSARISVASVDTGNDGRDGHLRTADWFDAESYPDITFVSSSVRAESDSRLVAVGTLTIKDQAKEIELPIELLGVRDIPEEMRGMFGGSEKVAGFKAELEIDRGDYGVGTGSWAGTLVIGGDVSIELLVEAHLKP